MGWPFDISEPDLGPLHRELAACKEIAVDQISSVGMRLTGPPLVIGLSACDDPEPGAEVYLGRSEPALPTSQLIDRQFSGKVVRFAPSSRPLDRDGWAVLLYYHEGRPNYSRATWNMLARNERRRAETLGKWFGSNHGLNVTPRGRATAIDSALVLWCSRVLSEESGQQIEFARTRLEKKAYGLPGSMWQVLMEALPRAQSFLALRYPGYGNPAIGRSSSKRPDRRKINAHTEAIAEIITLARSKAFKNLCRKRGLGACAADVAASPTTFRLTIADARRAQAQMRQRATPKRVRNVA